MKDIRIIISDTLLGWAMTISPVDRRERLARYLYKFLAEDIEFNNKRK
jgi:hypothetical protein